MFKEKMQELFSTFYVELNKKMRDEVVDVTADYMEAMLTEVDILQSGILDSIDPNLEFANQVISGTIENVYNENDPETIELQEAIDAVEALKNDENATTEDVAAAALNLSTAIDKIKNPVKYENIKLDTGVETGNEVISENESNPTKYGSKSLQVLRTAIDNATTTRSDDASVTTKIEASKQLQAAIDGLIIVENYNNEYDRAVELLLPFPTLYNELLTSTIVDALTQNMSIINKTKPEFDGTVTQLDVDTCTSRLSFIHQSENLKPDVDFAVDMYNRAYNLASGIIAQVKAGELSVYTNENADALRAVCQDLKDEIPSNENVDMYITTTNNMIKVINSFDMSDKSATKYVGDVLKHPFLFFDASALLSYLQWVISCTTDVSAEEKETKSKSLVDSMSTPLDEYDDDTRPYKKLQSFGGKIKTFISDVKSLCTYVGLPFNSTYFTEDSVSALDAAISTADSSVDKYELYYNMHTYLGAYFDIKDAILTFLAENNIL